MSPGSLEPFQSPPQEQICAMVCICATVKMDTAQEPLLIYPETSSLSGQAPTHKVVFMGLHKEGEGMTWVVVSRLDLEFYAIPSGTVTPHCDLGRLCMRLGEGTGVGAHGLWVWAS